MEEKRMSFIKKRVFKTKSATSLELPKNPDIALSNSNLMRITAF
jgi:hypothetical protein